MRTAVAHVSMAMLLSTLAADAVAQQRAPLLHPAPEQKATSQKIVAPRNSLEALDRHFSQLDRRRLVVRSGPRVVNPRAARVQPNPQLVRALEAHGRTLRAVPAAAAKQLPGRETSAVLGGGTGVDCDAARRNGVDTDHRVLDIRPGGAGVIFALSPGVAYQAHGCGLGKSVVPRATSIPDTPNVVATAVIHAWSDSRVAFTLLEVPKVYDFSFLGLRALVDSRVSSETVDARFWGIYLAPRVSNALATIPPAAVTVAASPAGSPAISTPMDFYGLKGAVGVARQSPGGLLPGQDSIEIRLARDVVLESVQVQYLAYDASGASSVSAPANVSFVQEGDPYVRSVAKIRVNWPVASVVPPGQTQPIFYSVYALNVALKGPKGMPAFDGIPSIVLN